MFSTKNKKKNIIEKRKKNLKKMWKIVGLFVFLFYTNYVDATYNAGVKTRAYNQQQSLTNSHQYQYHHHQHQHQHQHRQPQCSSAHGNCNQQSDINNDKDYQGSITNHHVHTVDPYQQQQQQQQQREGDYYHETEEYHQQPQIQPIYERKKSPQLQAVGNWQNSENSINEYYTGCPLGHTGQLPYAYDCRRFLNCWHGRGHIQTCSVGTVFNSETLECDRPDKVKCEAALGVLGIQSSSAHPGSYKQSKYRSDRYTDATNDNVEVLCPNGVEGLQPHPSDCTRFINCDNGNMHIQQCGPGTAYSIPMKVCDFKDKVDCKDRQQGEKTPTARQDKQATPKTLYPTSNTQHEDLPHTADILCLNGITGLFPYPFDYTKFIHCKNGNTAIQNCVPGTAFSISKGYCEPLEDIHNSDHVMYIVSQVSYEYSQTLITCPPGTEGIHLYPFNAEQFVKCIKSQMQIVPCTNAHVFSITRRTCLPPAQVLKHERVRLLGELQSANNYRVADDQHTIKNMVYCPGGVTGTYPHPFDSTKYLKCVRGRLMSESCASGQAYSLSRKVCSLKEEINADDYVPQTKPIYGQEWRGGDTEITHGSIDGLTYLMCPPGVEGYFLHPFDCTKYIECSQSDTVIENCINGAVYSISRKECIPRDKVEAYDRVEYMTSTTNEFSYEPIGQHHHELGISCNPGTFGIYPHPQDCRKYIRCANGRISVETCAAGQVFSITRSFCHTENEVDDQDRSSFNRGFRIPAATATNTVYQPAHNYPSNIAHQSLIPPPATAMSPPSSVLSPPLLTTPNAVATNNVNCPPGASGRYPHPFDCSKFLMCSNGETHIQDCSPGTAWNKDMEICDFKEKIACSENSVPISTTNSESEYRCPPGVEGLHQHPYDWHKYFVCNHGQTTVMDCAPGTVFSLSRKICDTETNASNAGHIWITKSTDNISGNKQWPYAGTTQTQPTVQVTESRWTNMNLPRPPSSAHGHTKTWQQTTHTHEPNIPTRSDPTSVWSGTAIHVDERNPIHTIIHEEGSLEPNRNYNRPMYHTPLAPLKPTTTTTTSTIVYAQPVGSQEDSKEIFSSTPVKPTNSYNPQYFLTSNRHNHTRHLNTFIPNGSDLMPSRQDQSTNTGMEIQITSHPVPPNQSIQHPSQYPYNLPAGRPQVQKPVTHLAPPFENGADSGQKALPEPEFKMTTINVDQLPGQVSYNLDDFEQFLSSSSKHDIYDTSNLHVGLEPPLFNSKTTTIQNSLLDPFERTTQVAPPPKTTRPTHHISNYPQLSNATIQTFPHQPHYSPPYSEVAHSRNVSWMGRKLPQHSGINLTSKDSLNYENTKITSTPLPPNYGFIPQPYYLNNQRDENSPALEDQDASMKAAIKLLLKPYLDSENKVGDDIAEKAQSHIMNLVPNSDKHTITITPNITDTDTDTTTTPTTHKPLFSKNTAVSAKTPFQEDVELVLAGEQHSLVGVTKTQTGSHETSTPFNLYQVPLYPEGSSVKPLTNIHDHNNNWHKHQFHDQQHFKLKHNREFHEKHPNLPNPFDIPISPRSDLGIGGRCPFECNNGKCVEQHQVCDGVNNCGNRQDEEKCEHLGYELRLTGGQSSNMGRVEVKILGKWGYVCDDKFGLRDADVVCRELGFKMGAMEVRGNSYYAPRDVNVYFAMDEVECRGNETSLRECDFKGWGVNNCGPDELVGVVCKVPKLKCPDNYWLCSTSKECIPTAFLCDVTPDCEDGSDESEDVCNAPIKYRLEGGRSSNEGRLEVFYRGEWGTVCDDDFGLKEAQVLCNSFGLYGKPEIVKNIFGPGSGPIWLDQVSCIGNETKLEECNHWSWGENNCNHTEDVGLKCTAGPKPNISKLNKSFTDDSLTQDKNLESTLQFEQSELDDLGLYQGLWQRSSKSVHSQKKCGHFKSNLFDEYDHPEERVVNGSVAKRGRHPWQATIRTRGRGGISSHWCGAAIISKKLILTAAHCLAGYPKGSYFVRMGDHYANIAESSEVDSNIENWYIHEKFRDQRHMNNDIALILLKTPVHFNDYVQPICLPEKGAHLQANRLCTISGWGSIKSGISTPSNILRSAQVPILADEVCGQKNVYAKAMTEGMFCAGFLDESADACDGDSGGPLVCSDKDGETLYGIISWGQHCGYANHPGVYVRVEKYIDWIYDKINLMMQQGKL